MGAIFECEAPSAPEADQMFLEKYEAMLDPKSPKNFSNKFLSAVLMYSPEWPCNQKQV